MAIKISGTLESDGNYPVAYSNAIAYGNRTLAEFVKDVIPGKTILNIRSLEDFVVASRTNLTVVDGGVKYTATANGAKPQLDVILPGVDLSDNECIDFVFTAKNCAYFTLYFSSDTSFGKYFNQACNSTTFYPIKPGLNRLRIRRPSWSVSGGESWMNSFVRMRVYLTCSDSAIGEFTFHSIEKNVKNPTVVILSFDDLLASHYTMLYPYATAKGLKFSLSSVAENIGEAGYLTLAQMREVYNDGHEFVIHSGSDWTTLDETARNHNINLQINTLKENGFLKGVHHCCYPLAKYNDDVIASLQAAQVYTGRMWDNASSVNYPLDNPYHLLAVPMKSTTTAATLISRTKLVMANGGGTLIVGGHGIVESGATELSINQAELEGYLDWLALVVGNGLVKNYTFSEWYNFLGDN